MILLVSCTPCTHQSRFETRKFVVRFFKTLFWKAIESTDKSDDTLWLTYWIVFCLFKVFVLPSLTFLPVLTSHAWQTDIRRGFRFPRQLHPVLLLGETCLFGLVLLPKYSGELTIMTIQNKDFISTSFFRAQSPFTQTSLNLMSCQLWDSWRKPQKRRSNLSLIEWHLHSQHVFSFLFDLERSSTSSFETNFASRSENVNVHASVDLF